MKRVSVVRICNRTKSISVGKRRFPFASVADWDTSTLDAITRQRTVFAPVLEANALHIAGCELDEARGQYVFPWKAAKGKFFLGKASGEFRVDRAVVDRGDDAVSDELAPVSLWSAQEMFGTGAASSELDRAPEPAFVRGYFDRPEAAKGEILTKLHTFGFAVLRDEAIVAPGPVADRVAKTETIIRDLFGVMRNTHYGMMSSWSNTEDAARKHHIGRPENEDSHLDGAYQSCHLDLHTDSTYFHDSPRVQVFGCIERGSSTVGGLTTLADGFAAADFLRRKDRKAFKILTTVPVQGQYFREGHHFSATRPAIRLRAFDQRNEPAYEQITFNNADRRILPTPHTSLRTPAAINAFYASYALFNQTIHNPANMIRFLLSPGDVLVVDNWRVLHGRTQFAGTRTMCGAYIGEDDVVSALRGVPAIRQHSLQ